MLRQTPIPYRDAEPKARGRAREEAGLSLAILLATCNGARYLPKQLQSYCDQSYEEWSLWVSDDRSQDATPGIIEGFCADHPEKDIRVLQGPGRGAGANFLTLLAKAVQSAPATVMAFSDQDDVWLPNKLERAMAWMRSEGAQEGAVLVWSSRMLLTDEALSPLGESRAFPRPASFGNALVQNILHGNTIVLSPAAAEALARTVPAALEYGVPYHDWWTYQVMAGIGARFHFDPEASVRYRQHDSNHMGYNATMRGHLRRIRMVQQQDYARWLDANLQALRVNQSMLTPAARRSLRGFMRLRGRKLAGLVGALERFGVHRQTPNGDRMLRVMARAGLL